MNESERDVLRLFRTYRMEPNQILCLHAGLFETDRQQFSKAVRSLIDQEMLVKENFRDAYSLTTRGYVASLSSYRPSLPSEGLLVEERASSR